MKRLVSCGIVLIALAVSGWSNASTLDIPELCGGFDILNDAENRVYRGEFKSKPCRFYKLILSGAVVRDDFL